MESNWIEYIPWAYALMQAITTLIVSIMGVTYVRSEFLAQKERGKIRKEELQTLNMAGPTQQFVTEVNSDEDNDGKIEVNAMANNSKESEQLLKEFQVQFIVFIVGLRS